MDIKISKRFLKQSIKSISYRFVILSDILIYIIILFAASARNHHNGFIDILGGFPLKQEPSSIYVLEWIVPRFILIYILFINTYNFIEKGVYLVFVRIKSKMIFYSIVNIVNLFTIFLWYICGYVLVLLYCRFIIYSQIPSIFVILKMLCLDILSTDLIYNIFYVLTLLFKKIFIGTFSSIFIYLVPIFTNNTKSIIFKIMPSNHSMYLRQEYLDNSFLFLGMGLIILIFIELLIINNIDIYNEGAYYYE